MLKIATHNSATGEKGTFWSFLVAIFSKTQSKTLEQQFKAGCRYFDLRLKYNKKRCTWVFRHGLWEAEDPAWVTLVGLNKLASSDRKNPTYAYLTYEGKYSEEVAKNFEELANFYTKTLKGIKITSVDAKYSGTKKNPFIVDYKHIKTINKGPACNPQGFIALDGKHWQTYLPIPWLWNLIYTRKHKFDEEKFTFVDFL